MKMTKEYWYKYSEKDVKSSNHRLVVMKPTGNFLFNGTAIPRSSTEAGMTSFFTCEVLRQSPSRERPPSVQKYCADNHYNRLQTPKDEKDEQDKKAVRNQHVQEFKHLFFDNNYVTTPVDKFRRISMVLPSKQSIDTFDHMVNRKVTLVNDSS
jgi:hypothetical protein